MRYTDPAAMPPIHSEWCYCRDCSNALDHRERNATRAIVFGLTFLAVAITLTVTWLTQGAGA